jgi:hypothetical protein
MNTVYQLEIHLESIIEHKMFWLYQGLFTTKLGAQAYAKQVFPDDKLRITNVEVQS